MTSKLDYALLAMDAYNRGDAGIVSIGLLVPSTTKVGDFELGGSRANAIAGFFAQSYQLGTQSIISYRGTDTNPLVELRKDAANGWAGGAGTYTTQQAVLAAQFYQDVVKGSNPTVSLSDLLGANVTLTGHSLGGGLAGFIASIYRKEAYTYDTMAYAAAATNVYNYSRTLPAETVLDPGARLQYFLGEEPGAPSRAMVKDYEVKGQAISGFQTPTPTEPAYDLGFDGILGSIQRHSQSLLVIRMYADEKLGSGDAWLKASKYVLPNLFNDDIATKLGLISGGSTGTDSASGKMRTMVAYSVIGSGTTLYGNTAADALFDDSNQMGRVLSKASVSSTISDAGNALGKMIAQYAGLLAVTASSDGAKEVGILSLSPDEKQLTVDLTSPRWTSGSLSITEIEGRTELLRAISLGSEDGISVKDAAQIKEVLGGGNYEKVDSIVFVTDDDRYVGVAPGRVPGAPADGLTVFVTGGGNDDVSGTSARDIIWAGKGNDQIAGGQGDDVLAGGADNDTIHGDEGNDWLLGGAGVDHLYGGAGTDHVIGGVGDDHLYGGKSGGAGDWSDGVTDFLSGGFGSDTYYISGYAQQNNWSDRGDGTNLVAYFKNSLKYIDVISDSGIDGTINIQYTFDKDVAPYFDPDLQSGPFGGPAVWRGVQSWSNTAGRAIYITVGEGEIEGLTAGSYLVFTAPYPYYDALFAVKDFRNGQFGFELSGWTGVPQETPYDDNRVGDESNDNIDTGDGNDIVYGQGGFDHIDGGGDDDKLFGGDGNDFIIGGNGADEIQGDAGDDYLIGGAGGDKFLFTSGDGNDRISDFSISEDLISLSGVSGIRGLADVLARATEVNGGTRLDFGEAGSIELIGVAKSNLSDANFGFVSSTKEGSSGDDDIQGGEGGDVVSGLAGDDVISGAGGDDVLEGGVGDDLLTGGSGRDVFKIAAGDGSDTILDFAAESDRIRLEGYSGIANFSDVVALATEQGGSTVLDFGASGSIRLVGVTKAQLSSGNFDIAGLTTTGSSSADILSGGAGGDRIVGLGGSDQLSGGLGSDTYVVGTGTGADIIAEVEEERAIDIVEFGGGIRPSQVSIERGATFGDAMLSWSGGDGITIRNQFGGGSDVIEEFRFANGAVWTADDLQRQYIAQHSTGGNDSIIAFYTDDTISSGAGDDSILAFGGNDILDGGAGNDTLIGGAGNDNYIVDSAGDVVTEYADEGWDEVHTTLLAYALGDNVEGLKYFGAGAFIGTGNSLDNLLSVTTGGATLDGGAGNDWIYGADGDDVLIGGSGNDELYVGRGANRAYGGDGDDVIYGGSGIDELDGDAGNDTLYAGAGNDIIRGGAGNDIIYGDGGNNWIDAGDGDDQIFMAYDASTAFGGAGADTFYGAEAGDTTDGGDGDDTFYSGAGNDIIRGGDGDDLIFGDAGDDVISGGAGTDWIVGGDGIDRFKFTKGDGIDTITDFQVGVEKIELSNLTGIVSFADVLARATDWLGDAYLDFGAEGTIRLNSVTVASLQASDFIISAPETVGTSGADALNGTAVSEVFRGLAGNDTINGEAGHDTLDGGTGNDQLNGGSGSDTYLVGTGTGADTVTDALETGAVDRISFGAGVLPSDIIIERGPAFWDAKLSWGTGDSVTIGGQFFNSTEGVEEFQFAGGTTWSRADLQVRFLAQHSTGGDDTIFGFANDDTISSGAGIDDIDGFDGNDTIDAGSGNDSIAGGNGNDIIIGGAGDDWLVGGSGSDTFTFAKNDGVDTIADFVAGTDKITLSGFTGVAAFASVIARATEWQGDTFVDLGSEGNIRLNGVTLASLQSGDFVFS